MLRTTNPVLENSRTRVGLAWHREVGEQEQPADVAEMLQIHRF